MSLSHKLIIAYSSNLDISRTGSLLQRIYHLCVQRAGTSNPWRTKYKVRVTDRLLYLSFLGVISIKKKKKQKKNFSICHAGSSAFCTGVTMIYSLKETTCSGDVKVRGVGNYELMR